MKNKQDKRALIIRIVAIVLAALMILSVGTVLFQTVFAADGVPVTGSGAHSKVPIIVLIVAVIVIGVVVIVPSLAKKKK